MRYVAARISRKTDHKLRVESFGAKQVKHHQRCR
jgi:hypothetical protein